MKSNITFSLFFSCAFFFLNFTMAQDIADFKWKNRVLLLIDTAPNAEALTEQIDVFNKQSVSFKERDLIYFILTPDAIYNSTKTKIALSGLSKYQKNGFRGLILLGKDGGVKLKKPFLVTSEAIISLIDTMPMRQIESDSEN